MPLDNHKGDTKWEYIFDIGATGTLLRLSLLTTRMQIQAVKVDLLHF